MSNLPRIRDKERLSPFVARIIGQNPSAFTLQGTNTYLIGNPNQRERVLIDTGSGFEQYTKILQDYLQKRRLTICAIVISHWHPDHYGGLREVIKVAPKARLYKYKIDSFGINTSDFNFIHWGDEETIYEAGAHLKAYWTPGHCDDHLSIWLEEEAVLFSGDNLLGHGSSVFKDYSTYMKSLRRMRDLPNLGKVYPGHGLPIEDGVAGFNSNLEHRHQRESEVLAELSKHEALTDDEIVDLIYKDLPGRPQKVRIGALSNTQHYLLKLESDGKVEQEGCKWRVKNSEKL